MDLSKKKKIKAMNTKVTTNRKLSPTKPKKQKKNKNKLSNQQEREQNHKNGDHMEGYQQGGERGRMRKKVKEVRSINGRYKIDRVSLRIL